MLRTSLGLALGSGIFLSRRSFVTASEAAKENKKAAQITLYQYAVCPFCNKVQTFLEYNQIPHKRIEVNPLSKKEMSFSSYKKVPFVTIENDASSADKLQVNGSDDIIDWLNKNVSTSSPLSEDNESVKKWRDWTNDHLIHLLPPNIYRTPKEALQAFDYIANSSNFSSFEKFSIKYSGALAMYFIAKRSLKKYNINDARGDLIKAMELWATEGINENKFHGGNNPDKADLAVYGVIRSLEGNYATWADVKQEVKPKFWEWYARVKATVRPPVIV